MGKSKTGVYFVIASKKLHGVTNVPILECIGAIQKVHSFRGAVEASLKSEQKRTGGGGSPHFCMFDLKKNAEIFKLKCYSYSPVFLIDYNRSMKY